MSTDSLLGKQLDEYRLVSLLGQGGMARVYLGLDVRLRRYVAVKIIDTPHRDNTAYNIRFEREAQAIAQLDHPHIVRIYRYGEARGVLYMAMQYVEGADLATLLATYHQETTFIPPEEAGRIIHDVCQALDYAHARQVIHRDIKPSNVMLDRNGRAILTDFGLALVAEIGTNYQAFGTPHYMSPEQVADAAAVVPQSDLYAVGIILFEMFTGRLPFDARQPMDVALMHVHNQPPAPRAIRPSLTPALEAVILRALAKDPQHRYPTGAALSAALSAALRAAPLTAPAAIPVTAPNLTLPQRVTQEIERHPLPPLPADPAAAPLPLGQLPPPTGPLRRSTPRPAVLATGCLLLLLLLCLALGWQLFRPDTSPASEPTAVIAVPPPATSLPPTPTVQPTNTAPANTARSTNTPTPTSAPAVTYQLLLIRLNNNAGLVLINDSDTSFPLAPLQLAEDERALNGDAWGVSHLFEGECVVVLAAGNNDDDDEGDDLNLPNDLTCDPTGDTLRRSGPNRFWRNNFTIFYNNQRLGTCPPAEQICQVNITLSPATP